MKILIVDDDKTFVYGMKEFLKLRNIPAITARNASEAIKLLSEEDISLVCTDWDLGDSTGLDVLSYAKEFYVSFLDKSKQLSNKAEA